MFKDGAGTRAVNIFDPAVAHRKIAGVPGKMGVRHT